MIQGLQSGAIVCEQPAQNRVPYTRESIGVLDNHLFDSATDDSIQDALESFPIQIVATPDLSNDGVHGKSGFQEHGLGL